MRSEFREEKIPVCLRGGGDTSRDQNAEQALEQGASLAFSFWTRVSASVPLPSGQRPASGKRAAAAASTHAETRLVQIAFSRSAGAAGAPGSVPALTSPASIWLRAPMGSTAKSVVHQITKN